ncbi:MAG: sodium:sulfate symporter, partial [Deltaproteobacteria bacterium]|nr:sodium:sulfate symporter [Deltaproteobacteria bacterium]
MKKEKKATGYDKYIDWKLFIIPVILLFAVLLMPTPDGMKDVGMEYKVGPKAVVNHITKELFDIDSSDA